MDAPIIEPTVGRIVIFRPNGVAGIEQAAIVTAVHDPRLINLFAFPPRAHETAHTIEGVQLLQHGDRIPDGPFAEWMPYQKGQAAKAEKLELQLTAQSQGGPAELTGRLANHPVAAPAPPAPEADQAAAVETPPSAAAAPEAQPQPAEANDSQGSAA